MLLSVPLFVMLTGCGLRSGAETPAAPDEVPHSPAMVERPVEAVPVAEDDPGSTRAFLLEGEALLAEGDRASAAESFRSFLAFDAPPAERARGLWGLAMAHFFPGNETHDPERAHRLLETLALEYPHTAQGRQALWLQELLAELEGTRTVAAEQAQLIEHLSEMVEQLRRIDLDRRPAGSRPDSVPRRPPGR